MNRTLSAFLVTAAAASALFGCVSGGTQPREKTSGGTATASDLKVELLTDTKPETGMTPIYLKLSTTSGAAVTNAGVTLAAVMTLPDGTSRGAPVLGPPALDADGYYRCDVVFPAPSGAEGSWELKAAVTRPGTDPVEVTLPKLAVADSGRCRTFAYTNPKTSATVTYVASLNFADDPKVGLNPIVVTIHVQQDAMTFAAFDGAAIALDPEMPSMGHGSPGSVEPVLVSPGRYEGKLSLSMRGPWETTVTVSEGGVTLGAPTYEFTF